MIKKEIQNKINEIENKYPYLHIDLHRDKFPKEEINKLCRLYKKLNKKENKNDWTV